jgi:alpha-beta hydrolase superfamily lysophospholipase
VYLEHAGQGFRSLHHSSGGRALFIQEEHDMGTDPRSFDEGSRLEVYDLSQDTIVNYTGTHYVRILKLFETPADHPEETTEQEQNKPDRNKTFHLRYYIPKSTLVGKRERVRQIVIMFNGLNEVHRFDLYDVLGEHLAEQGIAAVLLPTPYHLNRNPQIENPATRRKPPHALLFRRPMRMYYNYKQSMRESELLIQKLRQTAPDEKDFGFYKSLFDPKLKVSILGFSLGGLRALASFILQPKQYDTCIVFNSGVKLSRLNTELIHISKTEWDKFVTRLQNDADKHSEAARPEGNVSTYSADRERAFWNAFDMVFLGNRPDKLKDSLTRHSKRLLLILSGADPTVPSDISELEKEGHGLNVFRIAGVGHIPTLDDKWSFWIDRVSELIIGFIGQAGQDLWSRQGIVSKIKSALKDPDYAIRQAKAEPDAVPPQLGELLDHVEPGKRKEVINAYYAGMAYYPHFRDVLKEVVKSERTNETKRR